ncbi:ras-related and estrogen-regulated growth inhibitor-like protein [Rhinatrema bivittatum]|uniref:ras-related and estrogen-regulated growth inhibitor-like protein n=1 Tax=Rhinatrema bivittatum TaxID=194408 RepID=UPI00112B116C|nr:ras-related and estrogen-regulated growth inhibitor-like protein [Rhinatrema bivittatum]
MCTLRGGVPGALTSPARETRREIPLHLPGVLLKGSPSTTGRTMTELKLAVLGSAGAGKSALTVRFLTRRFIGEYASNSESIYTKSLSMDGRQMTLEMYDPCSQPHQGRLPFRDELQWADGFVVVYDISDRSSFTYAKALIYRIRDPHLGACKRDTESVVVLVGNKQDLCHMRDVGWEEGQKMAADHKCQFYELSAAEQCQEVLSMFTAAIRSIVASAKLKEKRRPSSSKSMAKLINNVFGKRRKSV